MSYFSITFSICLGVILSTLPISLRDFSPFSKTPQVAVQLDHCPQAPHGTGQTSELQASDSVEELQPPEAAADWFEAFNGHLTKPWFLGPNYRGYHGYLEISQNLFIFLGCWCCVSFQLLPWTVGLLDAWSRSWPSATATSHRTRCPLRPFAARRHTGALVAGFTFAVWRARATAAPLTTTRSTSHWASAPGTSEGDVFQSRPRHSIGP